jgi:hypothetical protein
MKKLQLNLTRMRYLSGSNNNRYYNLGAGDVSDVIGEIIDRIEFYLELEVITPKTQIDYNIADYFN